jgi:diguanylate cyclase (GGDEF)-like protein
VTRVTRILVIDDDSLTREITARICGRWGYDVGTADDGDTGLEKLRAEGAEVVLLDLMMPRLDGLGVLEALAKDPVVPAPAVILVTGMMDGTARVQASELGALDFVEKPLRFEILERRVKRAVAVIELERQIASAQQTVDELKTRDSATGAGSFAQLYQALETRFREAQASKAPLSCTLVADDGFALVLAEQGREAGDARLRKLAAAIETLLDPNGSLFRVDAAEFVIITPGAAAGAARATAERIRQAVVAGDAYAETQVAVGVATAPHRDITQAHQLYRAANVCLARARLRPEDGVVAHE